MERSKFTILVTGATGRQGGAVAKHLLADGWRVRALVRDPDKPAAQLLANQGVELVVGDLMDCASLDRAVAEAYGVFSVQTPREVGVAGEETEGRNMADAAKNAGVKHFVYSSVRGANCETDLSWMLAKQHIEEYVRSLGLPHTILRPVTFMENLLSQKDDIAHGRVKGFLPPDECHQWIAVDDIGRFAALAFEHPDEWIGAETEIAGDDVTGNQEAAALSLGLGRTVVYEQAPSAEGTRGGQRAPGSAQPTTADIARLRQLIPDLRTMVDWAAELDLFARVS